MPAVYDRRGEKPITAPDLKQREEVSQTPAELLDRIPTMSDEEGREIDKKRGLDQAGDQDSQNSQEHSDRVGRGYTEDKKENKIRLSGSGRLSRRKKFLLVGISGSIVTLIIAAIFGFLGIFKLEHIMSNIDAKTFARMQGVEDRRSRRWMQAYLEMRLADIAQSADGNEVPDLDKGSQSDNLFFRSEQVNNGNPIRDWYRTMRTSKFEQEVFEKHGFKFVSVAYYEDNQVKIRPGRIILNDEPLKELPGNEAWRNLEKGDTDTIRKFSETVDLEKFDSDGEARRAIKRMVNDDIPAWQVFLRRHVRNDIQNMIGVRDWRFFDLFGERGSQLGNKYSEGKLAIRNKILSKAIPSSFTSGQILRCLFGVDNCHYSRDAYDPDNQNSNIRSNGRDSQKAREDFDTDVNDSAKLLSDEDGNKLPNESRKASPNQISDDSAKLAARLSSKVGASLGALGAVVNITGTLEMLSQVHKIIPQIAKMAVIAKGAQAMGLFQVFETSRDQAKSGDLTAAEYNHMMGVLDNPTQSEGWNQVVEGKSGQPSYAKKSKREYCDDKYVPNDEDFHYSCDDKKIGSASNAQEVQNKYNASIGNAIGPIVAAYDNAKDTPVLGGIIRVINKVTSAVGELISKAVFAAAKVVGLDNDLKAALSWVMGKLAVFLGAGPILDGGEKAGELINWSIQGGAFTAETAARGAGASLTTDASRAAATTALHEFKQYQSEESGLYSRTLALSNHESLASKGAFAVSSFQMSSISSLFTAPGKLFANLIKPFSAKTQAAADDGYRAAEFAGIETYDFPPECYSLNPTVDLANGPFTPKATNAKEVFDANNIKLTAEDLVKLNNWDTHTNSSVFYTTIYDIIRRDHEEKADDIAVQIFNCNLLDTRIRGSLGAVYGYTADNGLEDVSVVNNPDISPVETASTTIDASRLYNDSTSIACAPPTINLGIQDGYHEGRPVKIRICALPNLPSTGAESRGEYGVKNANGLAIVNSRVSAVYHELVEVARKENRLTRGASSTFRTMAHQSSLCSQNAACRRGDYTYVAKPGTSNHQIGLAIDFYINDLSISSDQCIFEGARCTAKDHPDWEWLNNNAAKYGIKPYVNEFWHWSPTGN